MKVSPSGYFVKQHTRENYTAVSLPNQIEQGDMTWKGKGAKFRKKMLHWVQTSFFWERATIASRLKFSLNWIAEKAKDLLTRCTKQELNNNNNQVRFCRIYYYKSKLFNLSGRANVQNDSNV